MSSGWGFLGNVSGQEAEQLLKKAPHGMFLCRKSGSASGLYTLSVKRGDQVFHYRINNDDDSFNIFRDDGFASVPELIEHYRSNPRDFIDENSEVVHLGEPLVLDTSHAPLQQEKWFYGCIQREESKKLLISVGDHGSFLVRESQTKPGNYVLCIRNDDEIFEFLLENKNGKYDLAGARGYGFKTLDQLIEHYKEQPMVHRQTDRTMYLQEPLADTAERRRDAAVTKAEFEWLQRLDKANPASKQEGARPENKPKNRYKNILPFDHTLVRLKNADYLVPGSDYINADYVQDEETGLRYIAAQGCMKTTVHDFWQMVYQENTRTIIMLTNEVEKGKMKCVRYWPDEGSLMFYGDKTIANVHQKSTRDYIVRELTVTREQEEGDHAAPKKPSRKIFHYQYTEWPDHGVPSDPGSLLELLQDAEDKEKKCFERPGPQVIHCSAGIGRTGTVVAMYILIHQLKKKGNLNSIDVRATVENIRAQRAGMVQTEVQYRFIYSGLEYYTDAERKRVSLQRKGQALYGNIKVSPTHSLESDITPPKSGKSSTKKSSKGKTF